MLDAARLELRSAEKAIADMKGATCFEDYEAAWRVYLNCIEKCWTKVERGCQPYRDKFQPWQGLFARERRQDMLLKYLKQARDADNHSIQELAVHQPGGIEFRSVPGAGSHYIRRMVIQNGRIVEYDGDPMLATYYPSKVSAARVLNSGNWYNPPTSHLGEKIDTQDPILLAEHGLAYYQSFLEAAEGKFFS